MIRSSRGYTLLEVMVVILVIGFALSLAAIRFSPAHAGRQNQATSLLRFLETARERALFENRTISVECSWQASHQWGCLQQAWQGDRWQGSSEIFLLDPVFYFSTIDSKGEHAVSPPNGLNVQFSADGSSTAMDFMLHEGASKRWKYRWHEVHGFSMESQSDE